MARGRLLVALLVCACGSGDEELPSYALFANGERLTAEYYQVSGAQMFIGFYDRARGERCAFSLGASSPGTNVPGESYCLPAAGAGLSGWFEDASCTIPLAATDPDNAASVVVAAPTDACAEQPTVRELGAEVAVANAYSIDPNGACVPYAMIGGVVPPLRQLGSPIALDAFVKATGVVIPLGDRMGALMLNADDGAKLTVAGFDLQRNESTHPYGHGYELRHDRWWPRQVAYAIEGNRYADPGCSRPVASKDLYDALCPITAVMGYVQGACGYEIEHFSAGAEVNADSTYGFDEQGACAPTTTGFSQGHLVEIGELLPPETFAEVTTVDQGSGRVVLRLHGTPEGQGVLPSQFYDQEFQWPCQPTLAADGTSRCMPARWGVGGFSDAACTVRIIGFDLPMAGCEAPLPTAVSVTADGSDSPDPDDPLVAFAVGQKIAQLAAVYYTLDGVCQPHWAGPTEYDWYALGPESRADELERVEKVLAAP